ncbi:MAG TPA: hypothetical protein VK021_09270 [Flavobacteriaceae bacterium]|nr:hypothetical protein [Flavobacteriaceae bacterium]
MKKIILFFVIFIIGLGTGKAVPLTITNNSYTSPPIGEYEVYTFLGFVEDDNLCDDYWSQALPFIFEPYSVLQINNGSFLYSFNGTNSECISSFIGYNNCEPVELDWLGQRFYDFKPLLDSNNAIVDYEDYPRGTLGLSTGGVGCTSSYVSGIVELLVDGPNYYILQMVDPQQNNILDIRYNRYGNALATLNYE